MAWFSTSENAKYTHKKISRQLDSDRFLHEDVKKMKDLYWKKYHVCKFERYKSLGIILYFSHKEKLILIFGIS